MNVDAVTFQYLQAENAHLRALHADAIAATQVARPPTPPTSKNKARDWHTLSEAEKAKWAHGCAIHQSTHHKLKDCRTYKALSKPKNGTVMFPG